MNTIIPFTTCTPPGQNSAGQIMTVGTQGVPFLTAFCRQRTDRICILTQKPCLYPSTIPMEGGYTVALHDYRASHLLTTPTLTLKNCFETMQGQIISDIPHEDSLRGDFRDEFLRIVLNDFSRVTGLPIDPSLYLSTLTRAGAEKFVQVYYDALLFMGIRWEVREIAKTHTHLKSLQNQVGYEGGCPANNAASITILENHLQNHQNEISESTRIRRSFAEKIDSLKANLLQLIVQRGVLFPDWQ